MASPIPLANKVPEKEKKEKLERECDREIPAPSERLTPDQLLSSLWIWSVDNSPLQNHIKPDERRPKTCSKRQSKLVRPHTSISFDDSNSHSV